MKEEFCVVGRELDDNMADLQGKWSKMVFSSHISIDRLEELSSCNHHLFGRVIEV